MLIVLLRLPYLYVFSESFVGEGNFRCFCRTVPLAIFFKGEILTLFWTTFSSVSTFWSHQCARDCAWGWASMPGGNAVLALISCSCCILLISELESEWAVAVITRKFSSWGSSVRKTDWKGEAKVSDYGERNWRGVTVFWNTFDCLRLTSGACCWYESVKWKKRVNSNDTPFSKPVGCQDVSCFRVPFFFFFFP